MCAHACENARVSGLHCLSTLLGANVTGPNRGSRSEKTHVMSEEPQSHQGKHMGGEVEASM